MDLIAAIVIIVILAINLYKRLVTLQNRYKSAYSLFIGFAAWIYPITMTSTVAQQW